MKPALRESEGIKLCRSKELTSALVGIAQVIFASITIYRARGDQIEKYGYAAYGLSVHPYLLMSLANLIKLAVCGRYPYAYVLRTATLAEAEKDRGVFEGAVGNPREDGKAVDGGGSMGFSDPPSWIKQRIVPTIRFIAIISQPLFVFLLSGFNARRNTQGLKIWTPKAGQSTRAQRIWMLGWLVANMYTAPMAHFVASGRGGRRWGGCFDLKCWVYFWVIYVPTFLAYVFAFGGFVTVGRMLHAESSYQPC